MSKNNKKKPKLLEKIKKAAKKVMAKTQSKSTAPGAKKNVQKAPPKATPKSAAKKPSKNTSVNVSVAGSASKANTKAAQTKHPVKGSTNAKPSSAVAFSAGAVASASKAETSKVSSKSLSKSLGKSLGKSSGKKGAALRTGPVGPLLNAEGLPLTAGEAAAQSKIQYNSAGEQICREAACDLLSSSGGFCRLHYIKNWKKIKRKELILKEGKLVQYIEELVSKYPDKYLEAIRNDLVNDREFSKVVHDLELEDSIDDFDADGENIDSLIDNIKRDIDDDTDTF